MAGHDDHRATRLEVAHEAHHIAGPDPRQFVLGEDEAEPPGGHHPGEVGSARGNLDLHLTERPLEDHRQEIAITLVVVDQQNRGSWLMSPPTGSPR